jgi:hypothetical protein
VSPIRARVRYLCQHIIKTNTSSKPTHHQNQHIIKTNTLSKPTHYQNQHINALSKPTHYQSRLGFDLGTLDSNGQYGHFVPFWAVIKNPMKIQAGFQLLFPL